MTIPTRLMRVLPAGLLGSMGATLYAQIIQILVQFAAVPVLSSRWGLAQYGVWLLLFTIPSYLAMADLGFTTAAANDMTAEAARGDRIAARTTFRALQRLVLITGAVLLGIAALTLYGLLPHAVDFAGAGSGGRPRATVLLLVAYGAMSLQNGVTLAGFRASGGYAPSVFGFMTIVLAEAVGALTVVLLGGDLWAAALTYLALRVAGGVIFGIWLRRRAPWLTSGERGPGLPVLRRLVQPAVAMMAVPAAQAMSLQGTVLVIGAVAGSAAVPLFTTIRTLTRTGVQFTTIINHASMPAYTVASATDDHVNKAKLVTIGILTSIVVLVPAFLLLIVGGQWFIHFWTHGAAYPPFALVLVMAIVMLLNGLWVPISNLLLSINAHGRFSYRYLLLAAAALAACYPLTRALGPVGAGLSLVALDGAMLVYILRLGHRMGIFDGSLRGLRARAAAVRRGAPRTVDPTGEEIAPVTPSPGSDDPTKVG